MGFLNNIVSKHAQLRQDEEADLEEPLSEKASIKLPFRKTKGDIVGINFPTYKS